ncbi:MAG: SDR family oxidoreductase [Dehalococcoidia bacterium]|nr:SDR family oxidoreductase [Dehalococcoidia bacterium]
MEIFGLEGKNAVVVGGGLGMGKETAWLLAKLGCRVAVIDLIPERAESVAAEIKERGGEAFALSADVTNREAIDGAIVRAAELLGDLDVLANIVGMAYWAPLLEVEDDAFELELTRNMKYVFWTARAFARHCKAAGHGGAIVSIASISGTRAATNHGAYGAAKAALMSLTKTMAAEWGPLGIRVNAVAPGSIRTERFGRTPEQEADFAEICPLGRTGHQSETAKVIAFFASDLASYVTGQTLLMDGGWGLVGVGSGQRLRSTMANPNIVTS